MSWASPEVVVALGSAAVSLVSLGVAIWAVIESKKTGKLARRPKLQISYSISTDKPNSSITLSNEGLGPAVIVAFEVFVDGKAKAELGISKFNELTSFLKLDSHVINYSWPETGDHISLQDDLNLLSGDLEPYTPNKGRMYRAAFRRLRFKITYHPIGSPNETTVLDHSGEKTYGATET